MRAAGGRGAVWYLYHAPVIEGHLPQPQRGEKGAAAPPAPPPSLLRRLSYWGAPSARLEREGVELAGSHRLLGELRVLWAVGREVRQAGAGLAEEGRGEVATHAGWAGGLRGELGEVGEALVQCRPLRSTGGIARLRGLVTLLGEAQVRIGAGVVLGLVPGALESESGPLFLHNPTVPLGGGKLVLLELLRGLAEVVFLLLAARAVLLVAHDHHVREEGFLLAAAELVPVRSFVHQAGGGETWPSLALNFCISSSKGWARVWKLMSSAADSSRFCA